MTKKQGKLSDYLNDKPVHIKSDTLTKSWSENSTDSIGGKRPRQLPPSIIGTSDLEINKTPKLKTTSVLSQQSFPNKIVDRFIPPDKSASTSETFANHVKKKETAIPLDEITLSPSQKRVLDTIMSRKSVFFTGAAGFANIS